MIYCKYFTNQTHCFQPTVMVEEMFLLPCVDTHEEVENRQTHGTKEGCIWLREKQHITVQMDKTNMS